METTQKEKQFRAAFEAFRAKPFPAGCTDDVANECHADLALLSTELTGLLTRMPGPSRGENLFRAEDEWRYRDLKARLGSVVQEGSTEAARHAADYLEYLEALWGIVNLARRSG